jgi:hypothetical protein
MNAIKAFGLTSTRSWTNRTDPEADLDDMVEQLVELASDPLKVAASEAFRELWNEFEALLATVSGKAKRRPLRLLLEQMPVAHVDKFSTLRLSIDSPLLERCAFRVVAASVKENFADQKDATQWVDLARAQVATPTKMTRSRLTGSQADLDGLFGWIEGGQKPEELPNAKFTGETPADDPTYREFLEMMSEEQPCDAKGEPNGLPLGEAPDDDDDDLDMVEAAPPSSDTYEAGYEAGHEAADLPIAVGSAYSGGLPTAPLAVGTTPTGKFGEGNAEVDECYKDWKHSAIAAKLLAFLEKELPGR